MQQLMLGSKCLQCHVEAVALSLALSFCRRGEHQCMWPWPVPTRAVPKIQLAKPVHPAAGKISPLTAYLRSWHLVKRINLAHVRITTAGHNPHLGFRRYRRSCVELAAMCKCMQRMKYTTSHIPVCPDARISSSVEHCSMEASNGASRLRINSCRCIPRGGWS